MVIEDINARGGLLSRPLQIVLEDTATNEALAVTKVRKLTQQDEVDVVPTVRDSEVGRKLIEHVHEAATSVAPGFTGSLTRRTRWR